MKNKFRVEGNLVYVATSSGHEFFFDLDDLPIVQKKMVTWGTYKDKGTETMYVKSVYDSFHRFLINPRRTEMVDHINGNGLDNRKSNLRIVDHHQNGSNRTNIAKNNTSGYRGVYWHKLNNKFIARAVIKGKSHHIGYFETAEAANEAVKEFRSKNMPFSFKDQKGNGKNYWSYKEEA